MSTWAALAPAARAQSAPGFYGTADGQIVDPSGAPVVLRGVGLGGWLVPEGYMLHISAPDGGSPRSIRARVVDLIGTQDADTFFRLYRENYVEEKDVEAIAAWGYDHVRLPLHWQDFLDPATGQIREDGFAIVDSLLAWCRPLGLEVVLDLHAAPGAQSAFNIADSDGVARLWTEPVPYQDWTVAIWTEIARRYRDETLVIGYDLLNEPVLPSGVPGSALRALYARLATAIRAEDPNHILFIEGNQFATDFSALGVPVDGNMVYAFHKYWSPASQSSIQYLLDLRAQTGVPLWLGETGENSNPWFFAVRTLAEANGISWNWWTHKKVEAVSAPASAPFAPGYQAVVDYWRGTAPRPTAAAARTALFAMAAGLDLDRTSTNTGVLAALFDDDFGTTARPYRAHAVPGSVHAADYDVGDNGVAYSDQDPWAVSGTAGSGNTGGVYRNDGVDIERSTDPQGYGYDVGWIEALEWLQYTVTVSASGTYDVEFRVASGGTGGRFLVSLDGSTLGTVDAPGTGGWQAWRSVWLRGATLPAGQHVVRLSVRTGGFNLNTMRFTATGTATEEAPMAASLLGVSPNPARGEATVAFILPEPADVGVEVFDGLGRRVAVVGSRPMGAGAQAVPLEVGSLAPGSYLYRLTTTTTRASATLTGRLTVAR